MEGKVYQGVTVKHNENCVPIEEYIHQLVKEEVAAQLSQLQASITIKPGEVGEAARRYIDNHVRQPITWGEADSQNKTWESAKDATWQNDPVYLSESHEKLCRLGVKAPL